MNKKVFACIILIVLLGSALLISIIQISRLNKKIKNYDTIYCVSESDNGKIEMYYDFLDQKVYRYSIITTRDYSPDINIDIYKKAIENANNNNLGTIGKIWYDENKFVTHEIYYLNHLSEEKFKQLLGVSKKVFQSRTRQEIIDSIIVMGGTKSHYCK